jgi:hypothetical protein
MTNEEQELSNWLDAIAKDIEAGQCRDNILPHILKHAQEVVGPGAGCENMQEWMASLVNLVEIAKRVFGIYPTAQQQLERLQTKFDKEGLENGYTPNPKARK